MKSHVLLAALSLAAAVPLTACIVMVLAEFEGTRPIAILLSKTGRLGDESDGRQAPAPHA